MIDIFDDVLEEHNAVLIDDEVRKISWQYDYHSDKKKVNKHWHILCGHNKEECEKNAYPWAHTLFEVFLAKYNFHKKYNVEGYERIYCNAHTHGLEPHIHKDDGDFTLIYYPRMDWKREWGGGTTIYKEIINSNKSPDYKKEYANLEIDKHVNYRGNRLIVFDANLLHQAQPVSRECYELRTCVVFKCNISNILDGGRDRLDFYKK
jgi:hypothetical protein